MWTWQKFFPTLENNARSQTIEAKFNPQFKTNLVNLTFPNLNLNNQTD